MKTTLKFKGTNENWEYFKPTKTSLPCTISETGKIIGYCPEMNKEEQANEKLRASSLYLLKSLIAITDNIDNWLESGIPANKKESKNLYDNAKIAINKALL